MSVPMVWKGVTARRDEPFGRLGALYVGVEQTMNAGGEGVAHLPGVVTDLFGPSTHYEAGK